MAHNPYITPKLRAEAFNCPNCRIFTKQDWYYLHASSGSDGYGAQHEDLNFQVSVCHHCNASTIWHADKILFPDRGLTELPNPDLPKEIAADYDEAASILSKSPRGAAALLRLAIQKLCKELGQPGKDINEDIKRLVASGLPDKVQQALDAVRVIGNEAVHPGELDLRDDQETASKLFKLVNFIAAKMISEPNEIDSIYNALPQKKLSAIQSRDQK